MDSRTHALTGTTCSRAMTYMLKLGFVGVMNRWRRDLNADKAMSDVLQCETEFLLQIDLWSKLRSVLSVREKVQRVMRGRSGAYLSLNRID
jgi:hypothetical protein